MGRYTFSRIDGLIHTRPIMYAGVVLALGIVHGPVEWPLPRPTIPTEFMGYVAKLAVIQNLTTRLFQPLTLKKLRRDGRLHG